MLNKIKMTLECLPQLWWNHISLPATKGAAQQVNQHLNTGVSWLEVIHWQGSSRTSKSIPVVYLFKIISLCPVSQIPSAGPDVISRSIMNYHLCQHLPLEIIFSEILMIFKKVTGRSKHEQSYHSVFNSYSLGLHIASNFWQKPMKCIINYFCSSKGIPFLLRFIYQ